MISGLFAAPTCRQVAKSPLRGLVWALLDPMLLLLQLRTGPHPAIQLTAGARLGSVTPRCIVARRNSELSEPSLREPLRSLTPPIIQTRSRGCPSWQTKLETPLLGNPYSLFKKNQVKLRFRDCDCSAGGAPEVSESGSRTRVHTDSSKARAILALMVLAQTKPA